MSNARRYPATSVTVNVFLDQPEPPATFDVDVVWALLNLVKRNDADQVDITHLVNGVLLGVALERTKDQRGPVSISFSDEERAEYISFAARVVSWLLQVFRKPE